MVDLCMPHSKISAQKRIAARAIFHDCAMQHVDIFDKDFIMVPIHYSQHWSLLIICHPGAVFSADKKPCMILLDSLSGLATPSRAHAAAPRYRCITMVRHTGQAGAWHAAQCIYRTEVHLLMHPAGSSCMAGLHAKVYLAQCT